jgi:hypothetical protein
MSYLQWEASLPRHHKTLRLARELGVSRREAIGVISDLWAWVLQTRPSGMLDGISDAELEAVLEWTGEDGRLVAALVTSRWLDRTTDDGSLEVHGWSERAASYRRAASERERRAAAKATRVASVEDEKAAKTEPRASRVSQSAARVDHGGARVDHGGARVPVRGARVDHGGARVDHGGATVAPPCSREERRGEEQRGTVVLSQAEVPAQDAARPAEAAGTPPAVRGTTSPVVVVLPLIGTRTETVTEADVGEWSEAYPAVDVRAQLARMVAWLKANPAERPRSNGHRFAVRWLTREQDKEAMRAPARTATAAPRRNAQQDAVEAMVAWTLEARPVPPMPDDPDPPPQGALVLRPTSAGYARAVPTPGDSVEMFLEGEWSMRPSETLAPLDPTEVSR